ncbi:hypothetical protein LMG28688_01292 [Paraburkholderia caffeinitolerans]|uniref:Uncharacterized protein n=1 Tax=Paraburkholderia caffeinitolerans TaxID=1723730 RepID=A0A6J5FMR9_9BURK|nr:hypothetical protein LMG28688_01292 [Paraburkholderia caffeinitolerans]CAB3802100.1 hypothetical protein LMG28690_05495 [Paraburkholderia caffeinilytica]
MTPFGSAGRSEQSARMPKALALQCGVCANVCSHPDTRQIMATWALCN